MYIHSVRMKDFRNFEDAECGFIYPGSCEKPDDDFLDNVTLLIGENGAGKTGILKAICLNVSFLWGHDSGFKAENLVRIKAPNVKVKAAEVEGLMSITSDDSKDVKKDLILQTKRKITPKGDNELLQRRKERTDEEHFVDENTQFGQFQNGSIQTFNFEASMKLGLEIIDYGIDKDDSPSFFCLGYGASRRTEPVESFDFQRHKWRSSRYQRFAGLFQESITLTPLGVWFDRPSQTAKTRQKEIAQLLNATLPEGTRFKGEFNKYGDSLFEQNGIELPYSALSDGYRAHIGLVADMLYHLHSCCPKKQKIADMTGVVLIDDIDLHLHPKWQRIVLPNLAKTFPKLQFVITSHSPLVATTLHAKNVRFLEDNRIHTLNRELFGMSADQVLVSDYFGMDSTRSEAMEERLAKITRNFEDAASPEAAIKFLNLLAGQTNGKKK